MAQTNALDRIKDVARTGFGVGKAVVGQVAKAPSSGATKAAGAVSGYVAYRRQGGAAATPSVPAPKTPPPPRSTPAPQPRPSHQRATSESKAPAKTEPSPASVAKVVARKPRPEAPATKRRRSPRRSRCPAPSSRRASRRGDRAPARPGPGRPGRAVGLGQVHLGGGPLPPRGGRLLRRAARRGRQRPARPRRSTDAFDLLESVVAARLGRGLTTVVDTLGLDATGGRRGSRPPGRPGCPRWPWCSRPPDAECRRRNAARDRPVPAPVLAGQLKRMRDVRRRARQRGLGRRARGRARGRAPRAAPERARGHTTAARPAHLPGAGGRAPGVPVPVGRGPGRLAARRSPSPPTRPGSPGSR